MLVAGSLWSGPATADWLVTTAGSALETRGGWEVRGRLVVFTTPDGKLASLRLSEVDLDASEARTRAAAEAAAKPEPPPAPPKPRPKAKFVLTDADVQHVDPATLPDPRLADTDSELADSADRPGSGSAASAGASSGDTDDSSEDSGGDAAELAVEREAVELDESPVEVSDWDAVLGAGSDGIRITGTVTNPSEFFAGDIKIRVTALDLEGAEIEERSATMEANALGPGEQGTFEVRFPDVFSLGNALFDVTSFNAKVSR